ncbi:MAG: FABP family protein [Stackebrandtia sp.]
MSDVNGAKSPSPFSQTFQPIEPYPFEQTHDLRSGPDLHPDLLPLLPYVGRWRGRGQGGYPTMEDFAYGQEVRVSHDGRPFLFYEARSWLLDADDKPVRPAAREVGWWRPVPGGDGKRHEVELELCHPTGVMELYYGHVDGVKVELATDAVIRSPHAKEVTANKRLYGIVEGALMYAVEMAAMGQPLTPHLSARLERVAG